MAVISGTSAILMIAIVASVMSAVPVYGLSGSIANVTFQSTFYGRESFFLAYTPPDSKCKGVTGMALSVYLYGFGNVASQDPGTPEGSTFVAFDDAIMSGDSCCSVYVMPEFDQGPFGGYWYINNIYSRPEDHLLLEVLPQINQYYGDRVSDDPNARTLVGHSMGGFGAVRHSLLYGGQYFGNVAAINPALLIWNTPAYLNASRLLVLQEQLISPLFPDNSCPDNSPGGPYRYYGDYQVAFATLVTASISYFMATDFDGVSSNTPYIHFPNRGNCSEYQQFPRYNFILDENGNLQDDVIAQIRPDYCPLRYLLAYGTTVAPFVNGRIWLSTGTNDTEVNSIEVETFSGALDGYGIDHELVVLDGATHLQVQKPYSMFLASSFKSGSCAVALTNRRATSAADRPSSFLSSLFF